MKKIKKFLIKREVEMKKIILCLILIGFLRAFIDMPEGWRCRKMISSQNAYGIPPTGTWIYSKGDTLAMVFISDSGYTITQTLWFTKSFDAGFNWSSPLVVNPLIGNIGTPRIIIDNSNFTYVAYWQNLGDWARVVVEVSPDFGGEWQLSYSDGNVVSPCYFPWLAQKDNKIALTYIKQNFQNLEILFTFTENHGQSWSVSETVDAGPVGEIYPHPRVEIDADGNFYVFYYINNTFKLAKRIAPNQWSYYNFPESAVFEEPNRIMRRDPSTPGVLHFIYSRGANGNVYYRKFINSTWSDLVLIAPGKYTDFVVELGNKIYAVIGVPQGDNIYLKYYVSTDGGTTWIYKGDLYQLKYFCYEKTKRGRGLALIDVGTYPYGKPHFQGNDDYSISNTQYATAYNHNKHLARIPNTEDLYAVFSMQTDSQDVVAVRSLDGGANWENYKVIGHGLVGTPCIWIDPTLYCATYLWIHKQNNTYNLQYRKFDYSTNTYSPIYNLPFTTNYQIDGSSPAISMCVRKTLAQKSGLLAVVTRATSGSQNCLVSIFYNLLNNSIVEDAKTIDINATNPSISYSWVDVLKFHCVYQKDNKIYYSERTATGNWTDPYPISNPNKPAYNPSIEVYGDSLYVVWSEPESNGKHDIWRRRKKVTEPHNYWPYLPQRVSSINGDNYDSRYPTNSELKFTLWNEEDHNNTGEYDPWFRYNGDPPMVFYNTAEHSYFPHGNRYLTSFHIWLYGIWTEKDHLLYRILSHKREYIPIGGESSYLSYSGGENSPYLIEREGIKDYGNIRVDIGQNLIYEFHLDTIYNYEVEAEFYFEGNGIRKGKIITSNFDLPFEYKGNEIKKIRFQVKKENLFEDKLYLTIKNIAGPEVSLKALNVYRYEKEEEAPGGGQGSKISGIRNSILKVYPNFVKDKFILNYTVNSFSPLEISLYDILGRKVYTFIKEKIVAPGNYKIELRKPDNLKSGIYFLRMETQNEKQIEKIILH